MTCPGFLRAFPVAACLLGSVATWAGSDMFGSLPGEMKASTMRPKAGQTVSLTLQVTPESPEQDLKIAFDAPDGCAVLETASARRADVSLQVGQTASFTTTARVAAAKPCKIVASVVRPDEAGTRTGWVYAVVLNEQAPSHPPYSAGHDAAGHPTIDAVAR